jgi:hypothetical protein
MKILPLAMCAALISMTPLAVAARGGGHGDGGYRSERGERYSEPRASRRESSGGFRYASARSGDSGRSYRPPTLFADGAFNRDLDDLARARNFDRAKPLRRSAAARADFKHDHPCPSTGLPEGPCPGYVIDHIKALKRGGPDTPSNMQWQTVEAAKAKDRIE